MKYIEYACADKIATITINRPQALNVLNHESMIELASCWQKFDEDEGAWVAVLTSRGEKAFCAGADVKELGRGDLKETVDTLLIVSPKHHGINKPVICAVKGFCLGLGWWLAMECDLRVASTDCKMGITESRFNLSPIFGGLIREHLPPAIGLELLLIAEPLGGQRAFELGFINRVVENGLEVEQEAVRLAHQICRNGPASVRKNKELYYRSLELNRIDSISLATSFYKELSNMDDSREAVSAFREKRRPQWQEK